MAVKVMVAPAIANGELSKKPAAAHRAPAKRQAAPRAKRRRSAVYDAEGNEVFITLICLKCQKIRPLSQFGLRKMADGSIRNQPWCRSCRSGVSSKDAEQKPVEESAEVAGVEESPVSGESPAPPSSPAHATAKPPERRRPGSVAAEVAAALMAGRR